MYRIVIMDGTVELAYRIESQSKRQAQMKATEICHIVWDYRGGKPLPTVVLVEKVKG